MKLKGIDKKLHEAWREVVYKRAGYKCEICGSSQTINPHHFFGKRALNTRCDPDNGVCLCTGHHTFAKESAHQAPSWFQEMMLHIRGDEWLKKLTSKWRKNVKFTKKEKEEMLNKLNKMI